LVAIDHSHCFIAYIIRPPPGTNFGSTEDLFTGNQNSDSLPKHPVRRRPNQGITYAGKYVGTGEAEMNYEL
jgi:hypothetical protein